MAWKGVHLSRAARLSLADGQMVVRQDDGDVRVPLEDIAYVVLDTPEASLTTALLSACMAAGIALVVTDERHTPSGLALPFHSHHRQAAVAAMQLGCSGPLRKRLWQAVVTAKIRNQAAVLTTLDRQGAAGVDAMARLVGSGDSDNIEARAAREYWKRLFPDFVRDGPRDYRNKCLNYGYAVVRACIARALVAYGLLPSQGIHHASVTNAFNLADDMVEPFRPFVDQLVWTLADQGRRRDGDPSRDDRRSLAGLPGADVRIGGETVSLLVATEMAAASLIDAMEGATPAVLKLPSPAGSAG